MVEDLSYEAGKARQEMMVMMARKDTSPKSAHKKRLLTSQLLLKRVKHKGECVKCLVNCSVKHEEDVDFWALKEGLKPVYTLETCPKVSDDKMKEAKKAQRKRR